MHYFMLLNMSLNLFYRQKTGDELLISAWSSDVCSSDLPDVDRAAARGGGVHASAVGDPLETVLRPAPDVHDCGVVERVRAEQHLRFAHVEGGPHVQVIDRKRVV